MILLVSFVFSQEKPLPDAPAPQAGSESRTADPLQNGQQSKPSKNHIFWVIPNYRSDEDPIETGPLAPKAKFKLAALDSFDPSAFLVAGGFAGYSMARSQYPSFGGGAQGYGKYLAGAFVDQAIGNMMTEAVFPVALHQDPRYFVKGRGGFWKRTGYAVSREFITYDDFRQPQFNFSEIAGNGVAAGISNFYYPADQRTIGNTAQKWGEQIGLDAFFNVLKEFWPDVRQRMFGQ
jgi:hypothetical protein